jgi:hypothetical protein
MRLINLPPQSIREQTADAPSFVNLTSGLEESTPKEAATCPTPVLESSGGHCLHRRAT